MGTYRSPNLFLNLISKSSDLCPDILAFSKRSNPCHGIILDDHGRELHFPRPTTPKLASTRSHLI
mgnify:CR=1 FL=1